MTTETYMDRREKLISLHNVLLNMSMVTVMADLSNYNKFMLQQLRRTQREVTKRKGLKCLL